MSTLPTEIVLARSECQCGNFQVKNQENQDRGLRIEDQSKLRTFARKLSNIDFFLRILPLKDD